MTKTGKLLTIAALAALTAGQVQAGGMAEPIVEAESIVEDAAAAGSANGLLLPLLLLILIGAAVSGGGAGGTS